MKRKSKTTIETVVEAITKELEALEGFAQAVSEEATLLHVCVNACIHMESKVRRHTGEIRAQLKRVEET